jgi:hypothetical protein
MGGKGSGGARPNSGPKRRDPAGAWLAGKPVRRGPRPVERAKSDEAVATTVKRPKGLTDEDAAVWDELAPFALEQGTLTLATAMAFADLCGYIVMERKLRVSALAAAGPDHRGLIQRVESGRARFRLIPDGKPVTVNEAPKDEWAEFDGPALVKRA